MSKRCPPGVICFENITIVIIIVLLCSILLYIHFNNNNNNKHKYNKHKYNKQRHNKEDREQNMDVAPPFYPEEMQLNMYGPPLPPPIALPPPPVRGLMPVNVPTQPFDPNFRQVGILTRIKGKETILPLMGRPILANRDKWNFYTTNDKTNMITLPITYKGRSCTSEYGCDNLSSGDVVFVEGYNDAFRVTSYDNQVLRYIPFI
jgi:hypothetical protein